ncbi:MAG: hypothetical protein NWE95_08000 [Candidatus Bathyarchaeota archaeon]|nr:hypothetical protein [Candidatus Bathyarchaeota archaeon]
MKKQDKGPRFDEVLLETIDEVFCSLGNPIKNTVFAYLKSLSIEKSEIPNRISDFADALDMMFGLGAQALKEQILKKLHNKIGLAYQAPQPDRLSQEYIDSIKLKHQRGTNVEIGTIFPEELPLLTDH